MKGKDAHGNKVRHTKRCPTCNNFTGYKTTASENSYACSDTKCMTWWNEPIQTK